MRNRRQFIKKISIASGTSFCIAALSSTALLYSCSTVDDYLITDPNDLNDHVIIVGGGITGLYAAYQLKKRKIPFRIFESSQRLGGKFLSDQNYEYGAFEFLYTDKNMIALVQDLKIEIEKLDSKSWTFRNGTNEFIAQLSERVAGVIPTKQIRFQNQLLSVNAAGSKYKVNFGTPTNDKSYSSNKIFIALPIIDLEKTNILNLNQQQKIDFIKTDYIRILITQTKKKEIVKKEIVKSGNKNGIYFSNRYFRGANHITLSSAQAKLPQDIESISAWISENIFESNLIALNLQPEQIYKWSEKHSAHLFKTASHLKNQVVVADGFNAQFSSQYSRVENILINVNQHIDQFL